MTFIVGESCIKCKLGDCVEVWPVDCFHEGNKMIVINHDECIDWDICEPESPVDAIFADDEIPEGQEVFEELNRELSETWPVISHPPVPPSDADEWRYVKDKMQYLEK